MQVAGGRLEDGIVIGNTYDKYGTTNPIARWMMNGFDAALSRFVADAAPKTIHEVGCGEGYWVLRWLADGIDVRGTDFSSDVIAMARATAGQRSVDQQRFQVKSIYDVKPETDSADLIVCCEVMEHLEDPEAAVQALRKLDGSDLIVSVPREPLWRVLNMARGKYLSDLSNTPGHIQHFSKAEIVGLLSRHFEVKAVASPLPWTMVHCKWPAK